MKPGPQIVVLFSGAACVLALLVSFSNGKLVLTTAELKALDTFRPLVSEILTHDYQRHDGYLIRWLQAKKLNVKEAVQMLAQAQKWRQKNNIDNILKESFPEWEKLLPTVDGVDYEGRTVFTTSLGKYDFRKIVLSGNQGRHHRFHLYALEKGVSTAAEAVARSNGTLTDSRLVVITDLQGFSLRKHACLGCLSYHRANAIESERYYPGFIGLSIYINTPRIAIPIIDTFNTLLSEETRNAVKVFGTNRTEWTEFIHTIIYPDQLTYQFGGTKNN